MIHSYSLIFIPAISTRLENWALWWSLRKERTGITPSGAMSTSNSSPAVNWTFWTYFGIHSATYFPKSVRFSLCSISYLRMVARKNICNIAIVKKKTLFTDFHLRLVSMALVASVLSLRLTTAKGAVKNIQTVLRKISGTFSVWFKI